MREWFTAAQLAAALLPQIPTVKANVLARAARESWQSRPRIGRGGGREYHVSSLPEAARLELARRTLAESAAVASTFEGRAALATASGALAGLSGKQRSRAEVRLALVNLFEQWRAASGLSLRLALRVFAQAWSAGDVAGPDWLRAELPSVASSSLWNWRVAIRSGAAATLAGQYRGRREQGLIDGDPELRDFVVALILDRPHVNALHVTKALAARFPGRPIPTMRRLRAWIARWRAENGRAFALASNPDAAKSRLKPAFGSAAESIVRINQVWETDATPADVICTDGRHTVVGIVDVATRRARVLVTKTSKAVSVTALLKRCIVEWGVPETLKSDNGKDFTARHVTAALAALQIRHKLCPPFTPEGKPHIERFFGTMTRELFELLPGFAGHDVAQRQAIRARSSFAKRLGEGDGQAFSVALTAAELQQACDAWTVADYERRRHDSLAGSPFEIAAMLAGGARRIADERALDVLLAPAPDGGWRVVGKKGIRVDRFVYIAPALAGLVGARVQVRLDVGDLGRVVVYDAAGAFVCVAEDPAVTGTDRQEIAARTSAAHRAIDAGLRAEAKRLKRAVRPDTIAAEILAASRRAAEKIVAFPARAETVTTPALDAAGDAARALDDPAAAAPRPSYEELTPDERRPGTAEIVALTPAEPDPFPGWGDAIEVWEWSRRNPARAPKDLTPAQLAARIESWRADEPALDLWITTTLERERNTA